MAIKEKEKLTYDEAAKRFQIGKTTLVRWHKKLEPQLTRNKPATKINMEALKQDLIRTTMRISMRELTAWGAVKRVYLKLSNELG